MPNEIKRNVIYEYRLTFAQALLNPIGALLFRLGFILYVTFISYWTTTGYVRPSGVLFIWSIAVIYVVLLAINFNYVYRSWVRPIKWICFSHTGLDSNFRWGEYISEGELPYNRLNIQTGNAGVIFIKDVLGENFILIPDKLFSKDEIERFIYYGNDVSISGFHSDNHVMIRCPDVYPWEVGGTDLVQELSHQHHFEVWCQRMPTKTQYMIDQILCRIVPEFERHEFELWYPKDARLIGEYEIPLQRRNGMDWPTVQISFIEGVWGYSREPRFRIVFSALPEICKKHGKELISRELSTVANGPAYFYLSRGFSKGNSDLEFGFNWRQSMVNRNICYFLNWQKFLDSEIDEVLDLLPILFDIFDKGIPQEWLDHSYGVITPNVRLIHSWKLWNRNNSQN